MLILWYDVYLTKFTGRSELLLWSKYLLEHWSTKVHCDLARMLVRHQVKCAHYVNSKPNLNTDFWEIWREFGVVQLFCFIAYLICISFSVCQFPSAFLAEQLVNHLEFIKYFPLLYFAFHFQAFSPSPSKCISSWTGKGMETCVPLTSSGLFQIFVWSMQVFSGE